jgi:glycerol-1-phosphate dehydrogenase [NAD(P)+]
MQLPREVIVGNNTLNMISDICKRLGFYKSAFIVTGTHTRDIAGKMVHDLLEDAGINVDHMMVSSSTLWDVKAVEEKIQEVKPQVLLGIGGGTKIDVAKLSSARQKIPFMSIPTTASHDGIAGPLVSLKGLNKPYSEMAQSPIAIIADTNIIAKASHRLTASGCGDVIAKFTAVRDWGLAHKVKNEYYGEYAASLALMSAKLVMKNARFIQPKNENGIRVLLEALISCGVAMSIAGSSRPCSGSEHMFSHSLDQISPNSALHGEQCGVGTIMMAHLYGMKWKHIKETLEKVGAPTTAKGLGVKSDKVIEALIQASKIRPERYTILERQKMDYGSAEKLAKTTCVID